MGIRACLGLTCESCRHTEQLSVRKNYLIPCKVVLGPGGPCAMEAVQLYRQTLVWSRAQAYHQS